ncbi:hypothetical protein MNBD_ACTINO02-2928 [hydrothermal vent metagenome]|uniref:DUF1330 domain-containing protein n=1 Tax=hydrothermal vent metagenome TaxID=652676 RepID=A0A3B0RTU7_9ZZZZ
MYLAPTPESTAALMARDVTGPLTMLNLLRFRDQADYVDAPELAPQEPITGAQAYAIYMGKTLPLLTKVGGTARLTGTGGPLLIGPADARWDRVLVIEYPNLAAFVAMIQSPEYQAISGHRTAALADSRLLPIETD